MEYITFLAFYNDSKKRTLDFGKTSYRGVAEEPAFPLATLIWVSQWERFSYSQRCEFEFENVSASVSMCVLPSSHPESTVKTLYSLMYNNYIQRYITFYEGSVYATMIFTSLSCEKVNGQNVTEWTNKSKYSWLNVTCLM